jgi:hypothetical protein
MFTDGVTVPVGIVRSAVGRGGGEADAEKTGEVSARSRRSDDGRSVLLECMRS